MTVYATRNKVNIREKLKQLDKPRGVAGEAMLRAETVEEQQALLGVGRRNLLINGDFQISQRGTYTSATSISGGTYYLDRWYSVISGINPTIQHIDATLPNGQTVKAIRTVATSTSTGYAQWRQKLENYEHLRGQHITLSAWVRSDKNDNSLFGLAIYDAQAPAGWQIDPAEIICDGQWRKYVFTHKMSDNLSQTPEIGIQHNNSWQANEYYEVALFQMEMGRAATPFEHRSYGEELALCQRYGVRLGAHPDDPTSHYNLIGSGWWRATTSVPYNLQIQAKPPVTLRHKDYSASVIGTNQFYVQSGVTVGQASFYALNNPGSSPDTIWLDFTATTAAPTDAQAAAVASNNSPAYNNAIFIDAEI